MLSQYCDIPSIQIPTTCVPKCFGNVVGDGNCLYRSVSLSISGTQDNHRKHREITATKLYLHRKNSALIDEEKIDALINSAFFDGSYGVDAWGEQSHLIALSFALHIRIYVFNVLWNHT